MMTFVEIIVVVLVSALVFYLSEKHLSKKSKAKKK